MEKLDSSPGCFIGLCSWTKHQSFTVSVSALEGKWVLETLQNARRGRGRNGWEWVKEVT